MFNTKCCFSNAVLFVRLLREKKVDHTSALKNKESIALFVERRMKTCKAVRVWEDLESKERVVQTFFYCNRNLETFSVLDSQDNGCSTLLNCTRSNGFRNLEDMETSQHCVDRDTSETIHTALSFFSRLMIETTHNNLHVFILQEFVDASGLKDGCTEKFRHTDC